MTRQFRVGHTGITWGYDVSIVEEAAQSVAELGYAAFETFGHTVEEYDAQRPGAFAALLEKHCLPLGSLYCGTRFVDPADAPADIENVMRWARIGQALGAHCIVLAAGRRSSGPYLHYQEMADIFSDLGRRLQDMGLIGAIHPHTGTLIESQEEIDAVMSAIDPEAVFFAPDTGQIAKGGSDIMQVLETYGSLVRHVHLKDHVGGRVEYNEAGEEIDPTGYLGYTPIGGGALPMPEIFQFLEKIDFQDLVMVELDYTPRAPRPAAEAAAMSKQYLKEELGQAFRS